MERRLRYRQGVSCRATSTVYAFRSRHDDGSYHG